MAPEILSNEPYNHKVDLWSLMCILIHTATFSKINPISINSDTLMERLNEKISNIHFKVIIKILHQKDPDKRPDTIQLIKFINESHF